MRLLPGVAAREEHTIEAVDLGQHPNTNLMLLVTAEDSPTVPNFFMFSLFWHGLELVSYIAEVTLNS